MGKKRSLLIDFLIIGLLISFFFAFSKTARAADMWNQTYGGEESDEARSLVGTSDGGYAIAGYTKSSGAGNSDFWLVKTDGAGNMEWNRTYGGQDTDGAYSLVGTSDGGYALAGTTYSSDLSGDFWLIKTDALGNMEWNHTYDESVYEQAFSLVTTFDGGYALAGTSYSMAGMGYGGFWLVKTDGAGNMEWNQTYRGKNNEIGRAFCVVQTNDEGYVLAGLTSYFAGGGPADFWLVKTDGAGNMEWNRTYGGEESDGAYSLVGTSDGGYAIAGYTKSFGDGAHDLWLVKTDEYGLVPEFSSIIMFITLIAATIAVAIYGKKSTKKG